MSSLAFLSQAVIGTNTSLQHSPGQRTAADSLRNTLQFLNLAEISASTRVCRVWNKAIDGEAQMGIVWKNLTERMGIPLVNKGEGRPPRNYKTDLKTLYPITLSGQRIAETLGKPLGKTPEIAEKWFNLLSQEDPFEPGKLIGATFRFVCIYSQVERTLDVNSPLFLDEFGNLIIRPPETSGMVPVEELKPTQIPLSLRNLQTLSNRPLKRLGNVPAIGQFEERALDQCDACAPRNQIYFIREQIVTESINKTYDEQLALVKARGNQVDASELENTPLDVKVLYLAVSMLEKGAYTGIDKSWTYERFSNTVNIGAAVHHACCCSTFSNSGIYINPDNFNHGKIGVAPSIAAEVPGH